MMNNTSIPPAGIVSRLRGLLLALSLIVCATVSAQSTLQGKGTADDPYLLSSVNDWKAFAGIVNGGETSACAKMMADFSIYERNAFITLVGTKEKPYSGTFDGNGKKLSIEFYNQMDDAVGPFKYISGATIKNLHATGYFSLTKFRDPTNASLYIYIGGIVGKALGKKSTLSNCLCDITFHYYKYNPYVENKVYIGGMVGNADVDVQIDDCMFNGILNNDNDSKFPGISQENFGSLVGLTTSSATITANNCLEMVKAVGNWNFTTKQSTTKATNCYYTELSNLDKNCNITSSQLQNGEAAWKLQNGRDNTCWGQKINKEFEPALACFVGNEYRVYKVNLTLNGKTNTKYANGTTVGEVVDGVYPSFGGYTVALGNDLTRDTPTQDGMDIAISSISRTETEKKPVEIASKGDWNEFAEACNSGYYPGLDAVLTADINLGNDVYAHMIGTEKNPYTGTFDGQGHTLNVDYNASQAYVAPFRFIAGATIKKLATNGTFTLTFNNRGSNGYVGGIVGKVVNSEKMSKLSNCVSSVYINMSTMNGPGNWGGLVGNASGTLTIEDCIFSGKMSNLENSHVRSCGGFIGLAKASVSISNSLNTGSFQLDRDCSQFVVIDKDAKITIDNCYYLNALGTAQGTKTSKEQMESGELAKLLQNGRTATAWGQKLGTDQEPALASFTGTDDRVYKVTITNNGTSSTQLVNGPKVGNVIDQYYPSYNGYGYTVTFEGGLSRETPLADDMTIAFTSTKNTIKISSKEDWNAFAEYVNNGGETDLDAVLTADINLGDDSYEHMIGTDKNPYAGTFDGQGHTIIVNYNANQQDVAPFRHIGGATIKNLATSGTYNVTTKFAAGIVAHIANSDKETTLSNCVSTVSINTLTRGDGTHGGLVSHADGSLKLEDCAFNGSIIGRNTTNCGGLIGWSEKSVSISNSLNLGSFQLFSGCYQFARARDLKNVSITNSYYLNALGTAQGTKISSDQIQNGSVAYLLQNSRETICWGQKIGSDVGPSLASFATTENPVYPVYKVDIDDGNKTTSHYVNTQTVGNMLDALYPSDKYESVTINGDVKRDATISGDMTLQVTLKRIVYEIGSKDDWNLFVDVVNKDGKTDTHAVLTADINLGNDSYAHMIGTSDNPYTGTFDGQGHTLSVDYSASQQYVAPFRYIKGATIENLTTSGTFTVSGKFAAGIVARVLESSNSSTLSNCASSVTINTSVNGDGTHGGLVANASGNLTIEDCLFNGKISGSKTTNCGGLVGWSEKTVAITNSFNAGSFDLSSGCSQFARARNNNNVIITNSFYLNTLGTAQGTLANKKDLNSGKVAWMLQNKRSQMVWGQMMLGKDNLPSLTTRATRRVWQVTMVNNGVSKTAYANNDMPVYAQKKDLVDNYDATKAYAFNFEEDYTLAAPVTSDREVTYTVQSISKNMTIASADDWKQFAQNVNKGFADIDVTMTSDVDLGTETTTVGTLDGFSSKKPYLDKPYSGTFDGQGHTLTVNLTSKKQREYLAPFLFTRNATIRNLTVAGSVYAKDQGYLAGITSMFGGNVTIERCVVAANITNNGYVGEACGIFGMYHDGTSFLNTDTITLNDCLITGTVNNPGNSNSDLYAFGRGSNYSTIRINNCLFAGKMPNGQRGISWRGNYNNTYYLEHELKNNVYVVGGTAVSAEELKSGAVLVKLQGSRTDAAHWGQVPGTDDCPTLYDAAKAENDNYVYYDATEKGMFCKTFNISKANLPLGLELNAGSIVSGRSLTGTADEPKVYTTCLPYALDLTGTNLKAYELKGVNNDYTTVSFSEVTGTLEPAKPYLLVATGEGTLDKTDGGAISTLEPQETTTVGVMISGSYQRMENDELAQKGGCILQADNLWHPVMEGNTAWLDPYRAYLTFFGTSQAKALAMSLTREDGTTTGIGRIATIDNDGTTRYYDLNGRYIGTSLDSAPRGIYINQKGQKIRK